MFFINKKKKEILIEETNYWLSIGDLMASILMIFMLLFIVKTIETGQELRKKEEIIEVKVEGQRYFNFNKIKKMEKRAKKLKEEEKIEYKKELTEYINNLQKLMEEL